MGKETGWQIIFEGDLFEGQKKSLVKKRMAVLFNMDQPRIEALFAGGPVILKSNLDYARALKYQAAFQRTGAKCRIVAIEKPMPATQTAQSGSLFTEKDRTEKKSALSPLTKQIAAAFQAEMPHFPVSWAYKIGLACVDLGLVIMLLLYFAVIVAFGYAGYSLSFGNLMATEHSWFWKLFSLLFFILSATLITIILFFIIKPLWPQRSKKTETFELNPYKEQVLFGFVQELSSMLHAPMPRRIEINCSTDFIQRFSLRFSGFLGGELILTMGLPVTAGLNVRQLAGLLGHEMRCFSEGTCGRLLNLARRIILFFKEASSSSDRVDRKLGEWAQAEELGRQMPAQIATYLALLGRRWAWLWMKSCQLISGFMLQRLEYDADRHEAMLTGSSGFAETRLRSNTLALVTGQTIQDLEKDRQEKHLADDLIGLILFNLDRLPPAVIEQHRRNLSKEETDLFSACPAEKDRIAEVKAQNHKALIKLEMPAQEIFTDFQDLARHVTLHYYRTQMGLQMTEKKLLPLAVVVNHHAVIQAGQVSLKKYLAGLFIDLRPLPLKLKPEFANLSIKERIGHLLSLEAAIKQASLKGRKSVRDYQALDEKILALTQADLLQQADLIIIPEAFNLTDSTPEAIQGALKKALSEKKVLETQTDPFLTLLSDRLTTALSLAAEPQIAKHIEDAEVFKKEAALLLNIYSEFTAIFPPLDHLRLTCAGLTGLMEDFKDEQDNVVFMAVFRKKQSECRAGLADLYTRLKKIDHPFRTGALRLSLAEFFMEIDPSRIEDQSLHTTGQEVIRDLLSFHAELVGRASTCAEKAENAVHAAVKDPL